MCMIYTKKKNAENNQLVAITQRVVDKYFKKYNLPNEVEIHLNNRLTKKVGVCKKYTNGDRVRYEIEISKKYAQEYPEDVLNVITHEIIHTISTPDCWNHGDNFQSVMGSLNSQHEELSLSIVSNKIIKKDAYTVRCVDCSQEYYYYKKCKVVTETYRYRCGECSGELEKI